MTDTPDNAGGMHEGRDARGRWKLGVSGNPTGCLPGSRHRTTKAVEQLLDGQAETLTQKAVEMALDGDTTALRLCLERLLPPRKDRPISVQPPKIETTTNLAAITSALLTATADGDLTPGEAESLAKIVEAHRRTVELVELEKRVRQLEERKDPK